MTILFISGADDKYGAPRALIGLIDELTREYKINAIVLTKKHNLINDWCDSNGIVNYSFWYRDIMAGSAYKSCFLNFIKHCVKLSSYFLGSITQHILVYKYPELKNIDLIHTNLNRIDIGGYLAQKYDIPHVCHLRELRRGHSSIIPYCHRVEQKMASYTDTFIAISEITRKNWISAGLPHEKIKKIYNGIVLPPPQNITKKTFDKLKIVCVGRLEENKGQEQIIKALHLLPSNVKNKTEIIFVGEAYHEYQKHLNKLCTKYNIQHQVTFHGYTNNVSEILSKCNIGIMCSKGEAFGRVTIEYMAHGLLTIASNTGANTEIITDLKNGLIYEHNNIDSLAQKLLFAYNNPIICQHIILDGIESSHTFSQQQNAKNIYAVYQQILAQK